MNAAQVRVLIEQIEQRVHRGVDPSDIGIWVRDMDDVPFDQAMYFVGDLPVTGTTAITPGAIREGVTRLQGYHRGPGTPDALRPPVRSEVVPPPPWTREAGKAAQRAAEQCARRGLAPGHHITIASCRAAALEVQRQWEAANGRWEVRWRHWEDIPVTRDDTPSDPREAVTPEGRPGTPEEPPW